MQTHMHSPAYVRRRCALSLRPTHMSNRLFPFYTMVQSIDSLSLVSVWVLVLATLLRGSDGFLFPGDDDVFASESPLEECRSVVETYQTVAFDEIEARGVRGNTTLKCAASWASPEFGPGCDVEQYGCPTEACDGGGKPWCKVASPNGTKTETFCKSEVAPPSLATLWGKLLRSGFGFCQALLLISPAHPPTIASSSPTRKGLPLLHARSPSYASSNFS